MRITIHQPEHFPYAGFFQKMKEADLFVVLDNVKFRKNYFQNRNKLVNRQGREEWFGVSVPKESTSLEIKDVVVIEDKLNNWKKKVVSKLQHNLKIDLSEVYSFKKLIDINMASIKWCRDELKISTPMIYASELNVFGSKTSLLLDICKKTNATTYISGPSGKDYLDAQSFNRHNISVEFFKPEVENYYSMLYNIQNNKNHQRKRGEPSNDD